MDCKQTRSFSLFYCHHLFIINIKSCLVVQIQYAQTKVLYKIDFIVKIQKGFLGWDSSMRILFHLSN